MSVTRILAQYLVDSRFEDLPAATVAEAGRAIFNCLGCALGGSREPALAIALRTLAPFSGPATARVLGRRESFDPLHTALFNGIGAHVHEYDDTLPKNYIHPSPPVAAALFSHAAANTVSGRDFLHAFILGFETESRIGNAVYPAHYQAGWHITSTTGVFGAAAAIGKLLGLNVRQMVWALGTAATQAAGLREMFGSMAKSFGAGRAAHNGYLAALLAAKDFTAGERALEGPRGFAPVTAAHYDLDRITADLGRRFELHDNAYKPYPCGLVIHPTIDAGIEIRRRHKPDPRRIAAVRLRVAPLVLDLCNKRDIKRGLESKYSVYHAAAIGLVRGSGGLAEFTDAAVADPLIRQVHARTTALADPAVTEDQAGMQVELDDGSVLEHFVAQSLGNVHRPLSDAQLQDKFRELALRIMSAGRVDELVARCRELAALDDAGSLVELSVPD